MKWKRPGSKAVHNARYRRTVQGSTSWLDSRGEPDSREELSLDNGCPQRDGQTICASLRKLAGLQRRTRLAGVRNCPELETCRNMDETLDKTR